MEYNIKIKSLRTDKEYQAVVYDKDDNGRISYIILHKSLKEIFNYQMSKEERPTCTFDFIDMSKVAPKGPIACAVFCHIGDVEEIGEMTFHEYNAYQASCVRNGITISPLQQVRNRAFDKAFMSYMKFTFNINNQEIRMGIYGSEEFSQDMFLPGRNLADAKPMSAGTMNADAKMSENISKTAAIPKQEYQVQNQTLPIPPNLEIPNLEDLPLPGDDSQFYQQEQQTSPAYPTQEPAETMNNVGLTEDYGQDYQNDQFAASATTSMKEPTATNNPARNMTGNNNQYFQDEQRSASAPSAQTPQKPAILDPEIHRITCDQTRNIINIQTRAGDISIRKDPFKWIDGSLKKEQLNLGAFYQKCCEFVGMALVDFRG